MAASTHIVLKDGMTIPETLTQAKKSFSLSIDVGTHTIPPIPNPHYVHLRVKSGSVNLKDMNLPAGDQIRHLRVGDHYKLQNVKGFKIKVTESAILVFSSRAPSGTDPGGNRETDINP